MTGTTRRRGAAALTGITLTLILSGLGPAPAVAAPPSAPAKSRVPQTANGAGNLGVSLALTGNGSVRVSWKRPAPVARLRAWVVQTSTSRSMRPDLRTFRARAGARSMVVPPAKLVTPASGDYTFVKVRVVRANGDRGASPTKWVKAPVTAVPSARAAVNVGSFNVRSWNLENGRKDSRSWANRRARVLRTIVTSGAGVLALQEASGSKDSGYGGVRQYTAVKRGLPAAWGLVDNEPYRRGGTTGSASGRQGTRILYDSSRYALLDHGVVAVPGRQPSAVAWTPWAKLRDRSSGITFHVVSVHLETGSGSRRLYDVRRAQAERIASLAHALAEDGGQVFVAGDFNSTIYSVPNNGVHRVFVASGLYDAFASRVVKGGAWPTTNNLSFPVRRSPHRRDYIMSLGPLQGSYWFRNLAYKHAGSLASDHFMQVARLPIGP